MLALIVWDLHQTAEAFELLLQAYVLRALVALGSIVYNDLTLYDPTRVRSKLRNAVDHVHREMEAVESFRTAMSNGVVVVPSSL